MVRKLSLRLGLVWLCMFSIDSRGDPQLNPDLLTKPWSARWIAAQGAPPTEYGVYHFRRAFDLVAKPASFVVHVSGDNRYQLFVNGERVVWGPARGDLHHWRFETIDIARWLRPGRNVLAAVVWNYADLAPMAQLTHQTGFVLQGDSAAERVVDTNASWRCARNEAYSPLAFTNAEMRGYFVAGPGERLDAARYPWGWESNDFEDAAWKPAQVISNAAPRDLRDSPSYWMLVPRTIPLMEETPQRLASVRQAEGVTPPSSFPKESVSLQIPAKTKARMLLDQSYLTTAYPELVVSGGRGATISLRYAEALYETKDRRAKGNRNEVAGKEFVGYRDEFISDGGSRRLFRPLWWRTYRYVELNVTTQEAALTIDDLRGVYTGYPFDRKARFDADAPQLQRILDVGWRTARLDAHESYMDCPYYEQLQYAGDTRIQCLVSLYMSGDGRLMRNAIAQLNDSRTAEGATYSRAPSRLQQYIPPFSLWWIGMVRDYWWYQDDPAFVRKMLPGARAVLAFFAAHQKANGSLGKLPWWNYVDWTRQWNGGVPPAGEDGSSAPLDLQLLLAYGYAAELEDALGSKALAAEYRNAERQLRETVRNLYWDESKKLFADTPSKKDFSQHSNALAILAGVVKDAEARDLVNRIIADPSLTQCSIYFKYYLHAALVRAGEGDKYLDQLGEWQAMLDRGLTTWAEQADPTRSDCHAWGASPNIELFRTVLGIDSAAAGFKHVVIRPHLGKLTRASGTMPHPRGEIAVSLNLVNGKLEAEVNLPAGVTGEFAWHGHRRTLKEGRAKFSL